MLDNNDNMKYALIDNNFQLQREMRRTEREIRAALKQHGYKLTPQRRMIIRTIASSRDHLTPIEIYQQVRQDHPNIGLATVYRTLDMLAKLELICELHAGNSCRSYTVSAPEHHHHLICSSCGRVVDFTGYDLSGLEQRLSIETGFEIEDHLLEFIGLCQTCQKETK